MKKTLITLFGVLCLLWLMRDMLNAISLALHLYS